MTKIEFVLLADNSSASDAYALVFSRARRACDNGGLYIHTSNNAESKTVDEALWATSANAFVPHALAEPRSEENAVVGIDDASVLVGCECEPDGTHHTLINLSPDVPWFFSRFEHCIEVVRAGEKERKMGRERYLYYKRRGYPLQHRQL